MMNRNYRIGTMGYNYNLDRYDVAFPDGTTAGGLHCGQTFDILINGRWISTRIEMDWNTGWYLVGVADSIPFGVKVRL